MEEKERLMLEKYVDLSRYPLHDPHGPDWHNTVEQIRSELAHDGVSVLRHFIRDEIVDQLRAEGEAIASKAYYKEETVNAYNLSLDAPHPDEHPAKITMQRGNAFVARDLVPRDHIIHQLYCSKALRDFIAACFNIDELHRLADPLAGLCLNVLKPGHSHPWHFDINEFTISMLTRKPSGGGVFNYCPDIRSPEKENLEAVKSVLTGAGGEHVQHLELQPGDLQMFKGRYSLHQVSPVEGEHERHTAIFAYTPEPGVIGTLERTRQLFGRALPAHAAAEQNKVRADGLLD